MENPCQSSSVLNGRRNGKPKTHKKTLLETILEKFLSKYAKCSDTNVRRKPTNMEKRIAKLEVLIKRLQREICELSANAGESYEEMRCPNRGLTNSEGESTYSCSPCQIETVIVKDINFKSSKLLEMGTDIRSLEKILDLDASDRRKSALIKLCEEVENECENNNMEEEIDELIYELKSEVCNKHTSVRNCASTVNNSKENLPRSS
ncbi:unnamed protein product, partial [Iphiclides podalirius]